MDKKHKKFLSVLMSLVLITSCFMSNTLARYVTSTSSEDSARVAIWGINADEVEMDLFDAQYELDGTVVAKANDGDNIIAPGTGKMSKFSIVNLDDTFAPEVMYEIRINIDDSEIDQRILNNPSIQWKLDNNEWGTWEKTKLDILSLSGDLSGLKVYKPNEIATEFANGKEHTISWQWLLDDNNVQDTTMGNKTVDEDITAKIVVKIIAKQTMDATTNAYLLEGANQTVNLNYVQPLTFKSSADFDTFDCVKVDDTVLIKDTDYIAEPGSTVITLNKEYLSTLKVGIYTIEIISTENTAKTNFYVIDDLETSKPMLAASDTWYKGTIPRSSIEIINIVDIASEDIVSSADESWSAAIDYNNDGELNNDITCYINGTTLTISGNGSGKIYTNYDSSWLFSDHNKKDYFKNVTIINGGNILDTSRTLNMSFMFFNQRQLTTVNVSNWNVSNVTNMKAMFDYCIVLSELDVSNWNTGKVKDMSNMFGCTAGTTSYSLKTLDVSKWDTSSVENLGFMFYARCIENLDVSNWDVSKVKSFDHLFAWSRMSGLDVSKWDTSSATTMYGMFHTIYNTTIDVSSFDTSNVTVFGQMFEQAVKLKEIKGLENFDTSKGIDFTEMFNSCSNLTKLDISNFDTRKAGSGVQVSPNGGKSQVLYHMFNKCSRLKEITVGENFSLNGDGTNTNATFDASTVFGVPSSTFIKGATGYWYTADGTAYEPTNMPDKTANTYYAINPTQ